VVDLLLDLFVFLPHKRSRLLYHDPSAPRNDTAFRVTSVTINAKSAASGSGESAGEHRPQPPARL
jgi:hypothetical protein